MAYGIKIFKFPRSVEYEISYLGRYGAKGEKRAPRKRATPEQIRRQNQKNKERKVARMIKANFEEGDLWCTLKYPAGTRKPLGDVIQDLRKFLRRMKYQCRKRGEEFKFLYRVELGSRGGIHIHILIKRIRAEPSMDRMIQNLWEPGRVNFEGITEQNGYRRLAAYLVKETDNEMEGQLSLFAPQERRKLLSYSCSRNLIHPLPERKHYSHRTLRRLIEEGPKATPGYYIDKESIESGINPYTGKSYYRYEEFRIRDDRPWDGDDRQQDTDRKIEGG